MTDTARMVVGLDVGGTFTDVFFLDESSGRCALAKVPSTPQDQSLGMRRGLARRAPE